MSNLVINPYFPPNTNAYNTNEVSNINSFDFLSTFRESSYIEFGIFNNTNNLIYYDNDYGNYLNNTSIQANTTIVDINPTNDVSGIISSGQANFNSSYSGEFILSYNFLDLLCGTSPSNTLYIKEISSDRQELRLYLDFDDPGQLSLINGFIAEREASTDFIDFYLNFGNNNLVLCTNIEVTYEQGLINVLIKLLNPLPPQYGEYDNLWIVQKLTETIYYKALFQPSAITTSNVEMLPGPNLNLKVKDSLNNSTPYKNYSSLTTSQSSSFLYRLESLISGSPININIDYDHYDNFIFYSSAEQRVENFYYKLTILETLSSSIAYSSSLPNSANNITNLEKEVEKVISSFTGYENFLYYESSSLTWPKLNNTAPYELVKSDSNTGLEWLGSSNETSQFFGGTLLSASNYDNDNPNYLVYSIPEFIRENPENRRYDLFVQMIGEHFDNIWTYTKDITNKFDADNRLNYGISQDLVFHAIQDFGIKLYQNNFSQEDIYTAFLGITPSGSLAGLPNIVSSLSLFYNNVVWGGGNYGPIPQGAQYITNLISASSDTIPLDSLNKSIYKRIYHNTPYLLKSKGTVRGLRTLINCFGIPDTILNINEFGGKDKVNSNDWDYYRNIFNKELSTGILNQNNYDSYGLYSVDQYTLGVYGGSIFQGSIGTPLNIIPYDGIVLPKGWQLNPLWNINPSVPRTVEFRFKSVIDPDKVEFQPNIRQSLFFKGPTTGTTINNSEVSITLEYNGSGSFSQSYEGSIPDPNNKEADLFLYVSGSNQTYSASISNIPFLDQDWWSVMLNYVSESNTFNLYAGNKIYNGKDGTELGFIGSASLTLPTYNDTAGYRNNNFATFNCYEPYTIDSKQISKFSGSFQEIRYWTSVVNEDAWKNHIMNPLSIEGNGLTGSNSPRETLAFRTREGEDIGVGLKELVTNNISSIHPKITGSYNITGSFGSYSFPFTSSYSLYSGSFLPNIEYQFLNQPIAGIRNRVSDKIRVENLAFPKGDTLSKFQQLQQKTAASESYTQGINYVEIGFSPSNQINDDIVAELGDFNIGEYIGDPRLRSSSLNYYPEYNFLRDQYFEKYFKNYNVNDFIRLIKNFDNSLFKMIKDFIPARNTAATGVIIKKHILERQKYPEPQMSFSNVEYTGSIKSQPKGFTTGSSIQVFSGGTGGVFEEFNGIDNRFDITQSYSESYSTLSGSVTLIINNQDEFYNGEFSGSNITVTTQSLNPGCAGFLNIDVTPPPTSSFDLYLYTPTTTSFTKFTNVQTSPASGEMYIYNTILSTVAGDPISVSRIKVSTTDREGNDIYNNLNGATRLNFDIGSIDVTQISQGSNYIEFQPNVIPTTLPGAFAGTQVKNFAFQASGSSASFDLIIPDKFTPNVVQEITINQYPFESDPTNVFNPSTGKFTSPYTLNRVAFLTASIDYTASLGGVSNAISRVGIRVRGTNPNESSIFEQQFITQSVNPNFEYSGTLIISTSLNPNNVTLDSQNIFVEGFSTLNNIGSPTLPSASISFSNAQFEINTITVPGAFPRPILESFEPYSSIGLDYEHAFDCQPLLNNATTLRKSNIFMVVDYSSNIFRPINFTPILNNTAEKAPVPDSNYTSLARTLPRYNGCKLTSLKYNFYSGPGTLYDLNGNIIQWEGDISYGKTAVIDYYKPNFVVFNSLFPTSPELENATQVSVKYLVNKDTKTSKPTVGSPSFYNLQGTFESRDIIDIALEDNLQLNDPSLLNSAQGINLDNFNTDAPVIRGAQRIDPIITTQIASVQQSSILPTFYTGSMIFENPGQNTSLTDFRTKANNTTTPTSESFLPVNHINSLPQWFGSSASYDNALDPGPAGFLNLTNNYYENSTGITFDSRIKFKFKGEVKIPYNLVQSLTNDPLAITQFNVEIVQENTNGVIQILGTSPAISGPQTSPGFGYNVFNFTHFRNNIFLDNTQGLPNDDQIQHFPPIETPYVFLDPGDKIYVRFNYITPPESVINQFNNQGGLGLSTFAVNELNNSIFEAIPEGLINSSLTVSPNYWETGSNRYLTASVSLSNAYGFNQKQHSGSQFKQFTKPFTVETGDQLRFVGFESQTYTVGKVWPPGDNTGMPDRLIFNIDPPIPNNIDTNLFLLRRFVDDGNSIILDLNPPSSSLVTTNGIIRNQVELDPDINQGIDQVLLDLIERGII